MVRFFKVTIACLMISTTLLGCNKQVSNSMSQEHETYASIVQHNVTEGLQTENEDRQDLKYVNQEIQENLFIDAEVIIPSGQQYSTHTLKMVDCNPDRLFGIFCPEGIGGYTVEDLRKNHGHIIYHESSGKELIIYEDSISYTTYNFNMEERPMQDIKNLMYYFTLEYPDSVPHDLSFMTVAEMEECGRHILNQIGIAFEPKLNKIATLSGDEILNFQNEYFDDQNAPDSKTPTTLTAAEDTCYMQFNFTYRGIPLIGLDEPTISTYDSWEPSPSVTATILLNSEGIQVCNISYPCTIETTSASQPILSLDEAINALNAKYDLVILYEPITFTGIHLEYIPRKGEDSIILTPYWCFIETNESLLGKPGYLGNADRFNAYTGKDLAYGG